jgi:hypothetical protein
MEFLGKTIFRNFFRGKFQFFPTFSTFSGGKFSAEFSPKFSLEKNLRKIGPSGANPTTFELPSTTPAL